MPEYRMNSTSTKVPLWELDCDSFRRTLRPFALHDVTDEAHHRFVASFAREFDLRTEKVGSKVIFYPANRAAASPGQ